MQNWILYKLEHNLHVKKPLQKQKSFMYYQQHIWFMNKNYYKSLLMNFCKEAAIALKSCSYTK